MTTQEFSNQFDVLLNSFLLENSFRNTQSIQTIQLDEYEKSVYLTQAQEQIILQLYSGTSTSFESSEQIRRSLNSLVSTYYPIQNNSTSNNKLEGTKSYIYDLKDDVWFITYESVLKSNKEDNIEVVPITQDELHRIRKNPFRQENNHRVLRLDCGNNQVELISKFPIQNYIIRYLRKPNPIILADLDGLSINGISNITECELHSSLHESILQRAVLLSLESRQIKTK